MSLLVGNYATTTLSAAATSGDVTLSVTNVSVFPVPDVAAGETLLLTITDGSLYEIVEVTGINQVTSTLNVNRGMEGTTARAWGAGVEIGMRITAGMLAHASRNTLVVPPSVGVPTGSLSPVLDQVTFTGTDIPAADSTDGVVVPVTTTPTITTATLGYYGVATVVYPFLQFSTNYANATTLTSVATPTFDLLVNGTAIGAALSVASPTGWTVTQQAGQQLNVTLTGTPVTINHPVDPSSVVSAQSDGVSTWTITDSGATTGLSINVTALSFVVSYAYLKT